MLSREESRGLTIDQVRQELERRMTEGIASRARELDPCIPAIVAGHVTVNGAVVGTERSMMLGQDHVLLVSALELPGVDYVALGHIHKHQVLRMGPPMVAYSGSLQRVDFSEENDDKGFCVIDLDPAAPQGNRLKDFQFHVLPARSFVTVDVTVEPQEADPTVAVLRAVQRVEVKDAIVRVRVSLPAEADVHLRENDIRQALEPAHCIASISREVPGARRTRLAPEVEEGLQPVQALDLYLESRGVVEERKIRLLAAAEELLESDTVALE